MNLLELMVAAEHQPNAAVSVITTAPEMYHCAECALRFTRRIDYPGFSIAGTAPETLTWATAESIINMKCCFVTCGRTLEPFQT